MNTYSDKRDFDRFPIELDMELMGTDREGKKFFETALLKDVSGQGISFVTNLVDNYFTGQQLELKINLPGAWNLSACFEGTAQVVRIIKPSEFERIHKGQRAKVAVTLDNALQLNFLK